MKYILVQWPEVQDYMEYPWFRSECFLCGYSEESTQELGSLDSAYFIPYNRLEEVASLKLNELLKNVDFNSDFINRTIFGR